MKKKLVVLSGSVLALAPVAAFAQVTGGFTACTGGPISTLGDVFCKISQLLNAIVPLLIALGVVYFVWGVVQFVIASDEEAKTTGRNRMIYGIIGLAVIIGLWGLVNILKNTFGLSNSQNITLPTTPY